MLSKGQITQQELLARDVDIDEFKIVIQNKFQNVKDLGDRIISADVRRTIEGSSTLSVGVADQDRALWNSGMLASKMDVRIDGLWFRLASVNKQGDIVDLTFEDREIAVLRTYNSHIAPISRAEMTRAEFILRLLNEVQEFNIPYFIQDLHVAQPVFDPNQNILNPAVRGPGINNQEDLTIKRGKPNIRQINWANDILAQATGQILDTNPHKRKLMVCMMMTAIQESSVQDKDPGDNIDHNDSYGIFQQRPSSGYPKQTMPIKTVSTFRQAQEFLNRAIAMDQRFPNLSKNDLCQDVQHSAFPNAYGQWETEASHWVDAYGATGGDGILPQAQFNLQNDYTTASGKYHFFRGVPPSRKNDGWQLESSWACIQRLAQEVNWLAFFVSGTFYYCSEDYLFKSQPRAILSESSDGVDFINGDYDPNKKIASATIECRMGRWEVPPGTVVKLKDSGPHNGRWLVATVERDLFKPNGEITLKKSNPVFMEPATDSLPNDYSGANTVRKITKRAAKLYPDFEWEDRKFLAQYVIDAYNETPQRYRDDNGRQMQQWRKTAAGQSLVSQCKVNNTYLEYPMDSEVGQVVVTLLEAGYYVGSQALAEDHYCHVDNNPSKSISAHASGRAIDISSLGKPGIGWKHIGDVSPTDQVAKKMIKEVMILLRDLNPSQIICNGMGGVQLIDIQGEQWNNGKQVNYITTGHTDHIHVGFSL